MKWVNFVSLHYHTYIWSWRTQNAQKKSSVISINYHYLIFTLPKQFKPITVKTKLAQMYFHVHITNHKINYLHNNTLTLINNTTLNLELKKFTCQSKVGPFNSWMLTVLQVTLNHSQQYQRPSKTINNIRQFLFWTVTSSNLCPWFAKNK